VSVRQVQLTRVKAYTHNFLRFEKNREYLRFVKNIMFSPIYLPKHLQMYYLQNAYKAKLIWKIFFQKKISKCVP